MDRACSGLSILSPGTYLSHFLSVLLGFTLGYWFNYEHHSGTFATGTPPGNVSYVNTNLAPAVSYTNAMLQELSAPGFSCNSAQAYEELTNLHKRAHSLTEHKKNGEANRARIATIERKAVAAQAAENAFRKCVNSMMPEVLQLWDDQFKHGQINFKAWDDSSEKAIDGITLQVLEETADNFGQL